MRGEIAKFADLILAQMQKQFYIHPAAELVAVRFELNVMSFGDITQQGTEEGKVVEDDDLF